MIKAGGQVRKGKGFWDSAAKYTIGAAGAAAGGVLGSIVPGPGTLIGSAAGSYAADQLNGAIFGRQARPRRR